MALPRVNELPKYEVTVPSTGQKVRYRPYLVKEEKALMMAFETGDEIVGLNAVIDTINSCLDNPIDRSKLTSYDIEYLLLRIRSKSVGETINIAVKCKECEHGNDQTVIIDDIGLKSKEVDKVIKLTNAISLEMKFPSLDDLKGIESTNTESMFEVLTKCIDAVLTEEERIAFADESKEDKMDFLESLTGDQFRLLSDFLQGIPKLSHDIEFKCTKCEADNIVTVEGLQSFFT
jgi:hypothetical protein